MMTNNLTKRDWEALSAYIDNQLKPRERARLEARLSAEPALQAGLHELNQTRTLLRKVPAVRAPRNFTLTPKMAGSRPFLLRIYPVLQSAAVVATVLFALVITLQFTGFVAVNRAFTPAAGPELMAFEALPVEEAAEDRAADVLEFGESQALEGEGGVEPQFEKSLLPAYPSAADEFMTEEVLPEAAMAGTESGLEASRATAASTDMSEESLEGEAPQAPEAFAAEPLQSTPTLQPTETPKPSPTLEPTAVPTPLPTPTPTFVVFLRQNPLLIPAWVPWVLGGFALWAGAFALFFRWRQS